MESFQLNHSCPIVEETNVEKFFNMENILKRVALYSVFSSL